MTSTIYLYLALLLLVKVLLSFVTKKFTEPLTTVSLCTAKSRECHRHHLYTLMSQVAPTGRKCCSAHLCRYSHRIQRKDRGKKEYMEIQRRKTFEFKEFQNELHVFWNVAAYCAICSCIYCEWRPSFDYQNPGKILFMPKTEHQYFTIAFISQDSC